MNKSRDKLEKELAIVLQEKSSKRRELQRLIKEAREKFNIPERESSDFINMRKNLIEADTFTLFILTYLLLPIEKLNEYFTKAEVKELSKAKWFVDRVVFPLRFDMVKITDEQYIGHISVKELMRLKDAQYINYNENAQRTMRHIVKGEMEYYQIALNKEAVYAIMDSYDSDLYIPNTITLNLPEDADYSYDEKKHQLVIRDAEYLDILDGYHRYIAMSKKHSQDPDFNYDMELRIVQFTEDKAKRFIWQEDQKTKMRKVDSDSMDSAKVSNKIVERMNSDSKFLLSGKISRNKGLINAAYFSNIIDVVLLKGIKKSEELKYIRLIAINLEDYIEELCSEYPDYLETEWDKKFIYMLVYEYRYGNIKSLIDDYAKIKDNDSIYAGARISPADITRTHKLLGKGVK